MHAPDESGREPARPGSLQMKSRALYTLNVAGRSVPFGFRVQLPAGLWLSG
jgi:hypothetical protein